MIARFKTPLIALILGLVPYVLFVGSSQTVDVNGVRVTDNQFNIIGLILGGVGIVMAGRFLFSPAAKDWMGRTLAAIAIAVCALQVAASVDVVRPVELVNSWINPDSDLPPLKYGGVDDGLREFAQFIINGSAPLEEDIAVRSAFMLDRAHEHMDYADVCHESRYRVDYEKLLAQSAALPAEMASGISEHAARLRRPVPAADSCKPLNTEYKMGELVDDVLVDYDVLEILIAKWRETNPQ